MKNFPNKPAPYTFYQEYIEGYLKENFNNFYQKHEYFLMILNNPNIVNTSYFYQRFIESLYGFQRILEDKLKSYFTQTWNDLFYDKPKNDYEEYDFEKDIIENLLVHNDMSKYRNIQNFKDFVDNQNRSEISRMEHAPSYITENQSINVHKKEVCDMELDNCNTSISAKSFDHHNSSTFNPHKKFIVLKKDISLRSCPPSEKIKSKIPFLKDFNIRFTKRENIDKKLVRKFRKFLKGYFQRENINISTIEDNDFWTAFVNEELYPPTKFRCIEQNRVYEFKSFNTNYMAWIFSIKHAEWLYNQFIREKGEEVCASIVKKNQRAINSFDSQQKNQICDQLKYYINNLANIFNINRERDEVNCEVMPATTPNTKGDVYDELLQFDVNAFFNEESHYNIKKKSNNELCRFE